MTYCNDPAPSRTSPASLPEKNARPPDVMQDLDLQSLGRLEFAFIAHAPQKLHANPSGRGRMEGRQQECFDRQPSFPAVRNVGR